jgi:hypothetical protein
MRLARHSRTMFGDRNDFKALRVSTISDARDTTEA